MTANSIVTTLKDLILAAVQKDLLLVMMTGIAQVKFIHDRRKTIILLFYNKNVYSQ